MELSNQQQLMRQTRTSDGRIVIVQEDMYTQVFLPIEEKVRLQLNHLFNQRN